LGGYFFRVASSLIELDAIRCDWRQLVLVYKEGQQKESSANPNNLIWRSGELYRALGGMVMQS
jgi:hypothetical protein